jgi:hypothetical protein
MKINQNNVLLAIGEYSIKGELLTSKYASDAISNPLMNEGITFTSIHSLLSDDDETFFDLLREKFDSTTLLYGKVGVETIQELSTSYGVTVAGTVSLYEVPSFSLLGTTYEVRAVGTGESEQQAIHNAFKQFGDISVSLIKRVLYE